MAAWNESRSLVRRVLGGVVAMVCAWSATVVHAQDAPQTLDRIDVIKPQGATNVAVEVNALSGAAPWVATDYLGVSGTAFTSCASTSTRGFFCVDNNVVRRWSNPEIPPVSPPVDGAALFSCANSAFGFSNPCTGFAIDTAGNMWLAGPKKSKSSLYKVLRLLQGSCPSQWTSFTTPAGTFCAREFASGRGVLTNLTVVDGATAAAFPYSEGGVIAVEDGKSATFFRNVPLATPVVLVPSNLLGLSGGDQLQTATLLQKLLPPSSRNWVVMATLSGKLLSREIPFTATISTPVVNHASQASIVSPTSCGPTALYDAQWSPKTHATIVSDRRGCRLMSMLSNIDATGFTNTTPLVFSTPQVIASTTPGTGQAALAAAPEAVSMAPGVEVDLRAECGFDNSGTPLECVIVPDGGDPNFVGAASLKGVKIDSGTPGGLTVFNVPDLQDCRYTRFSMQTAQCKNGAILTANGRVIDDPNDPQEYTPSGLPLHPELLFLDVSKLLPVEISQAVTLPRMLISPKYNALEDTNTFGLVFGVTDEGVLFRDTFLASFHLDDLIPDRKLGCGGENDADGEKLIDTSAGPQWDVLLTISDKYTTVGGLTGGSRQFTDMLVNKAGCDDNDPPAAGTRWSLYAYGLKLSATVSTADPQHQGEFLRRYPDSVFAQLVLSLFSDLGATIDTYGCIDRDGDNGAPLSATTCTALKTAWLNVNDKLTKCVQSSTDPMNSTEIRTCNAFEVQYGPFRDQVNALVRAAGTTDPANRIGELKARLEVFRYVYDKQYKPSIPFATGFIDGL